MTSPNEQAEEVDPSESVPSDPDGMKKYKNKIFAKESRERKKRYVKELEIKVEALEEKVAKLSMELEQYKNLLRVSDISEIKDLKLKTVRQEFTDTKMYLREQLRSECFNKDFSADHWKKTLAVANADIGPKGILRRKLLKTAFKVIIKYIAPEQPIYFGYLGEFEEKATKRDMGFMKKLNQQQTLHYIKEKGFEGLDALIAICEFSSEEIGTIFQSQISCLRYEFFI